MYRQRSGFSEKHRAAEMRMLPPAQPSPVRLLPVLHSLHCAVIPRRSLPFHRASSQSAFRRSRRAVGSVAEIGADSIFRLRPRSRCCACIVLSVSAHALLRSFSRQLSDAPVRMRRALDAEPKSGCR